MQQSPNKSIISLILSMVIFGTIGIFVRNISMPSSLIALCRGSIGALFLFLVTVIRRQYISGSAVRRNLLYLILSGGFLGFNWILLFEAYRYTTVATATLCYYLAPVFVILVSPLVLKERLTVKQLICAALALIGMVFVSGVPESGIPSAGEAKGILLGVGAAVLYASIVLLNKKMKDIGAYDMTILQLGISAVVVLPYVLLTVESAEVQVGPVSVLLVILVAIIHTGVAYALYFGSVGGLKGQTVALYSYIDPVVAILLSALLLREDMSVFSVIGAVLVLGSTFFSEISERKN